MIQDRFDNLIFIVSIINTRKYYKNLKDNTDKTMTCSPVTGIEEIFNINIYKSPLPSPLVDLGKYS